MCVTNLKVFNQSKSMADGPIFFVTIQPLTFHFVDIVDTMEEGIFKVEAMIDGFILFVACQELAIVLHCSKSWFALMDSIRK